MELTIGWLYPKEMSTYGDRGNILTLVKRCQWRKIKAKVVSIGLNEPIEEKIDLYFFGGGQDKAQSAVSEDLHRTKKAHLIQEAQKGTVFLSICGGYQLLSKYYRPHQGPDMPGIGLLDSYTIAGEKRMIGNLAVETNSDLLKTTLVGFENHSGKTYLEKGTSSLGRVLIGYGNNGEDRTEGAWKGNIFGCYLHGPLLPKNPRFADLLLEKALQRRNGDVSLTPLEDFIENSAHESAFNRAKAVPKI